MSDTTAKPVAWRHKELVNGEFETDWILTKSEPPDGVRVTAKEALHPQSTVDALRAEVEMLRGQRMALLELLGEAAHVIHNLPDEVETQDEADMLNALKDRIADARGAVLLELAR